MKKILAILTLLLTTSVFTAQAQRYAVLDSDYILENISDYKRAQEKLDEFSKNWQKEIDNKIAEVERLYKSYQAEQVMLSKEMRKQREEGIMSAERDAKELQKSRFGYEGDLFKKRQELVKPIQDRVYNSVQKISKRKGYDVIFDKSADLSVFYNSTKVDISNEVLLDLGVTNPKRN